MKIKQLIETENVKGANRVLKNLLERTRTENVGLGLFYGRPGLGKSRWATKTAQDNGYVYIRLESNITPKDFLRNLLSRLLHKTMPNYNVTGTQHELYSQILDILQNDQNIVVIVDEVEYGFTNERILASIRDLIDQSLATFVLIGMEKVKDRLQKIPCFFDRCVGGFFEFKSLTLPDTEKIINELCEIKVDNEIIKYIHNRCNGTMRLINKHLDALEKIARRMSKKELYFNDIKDIISRVEV